MSRDYAALPGIGLCDIYPVGSLAAMQFAWNALTRPGIPSEKRWPMASREVRKQVRYLRHQIGARNWRAVRNNFNGYLAEPYEIHSGMTRCGKGWTKKSAVADLLKHYREVTA